jgi:hypothetical protein
MKQALLIVDVQPSFPVPMEILHGIRGLSAILPSVATVERHDESVTPFEGQLRWKPGKADETLISANRVFIKHGYLPPPAAIEYLRGLRMDGILVCGVQADTCVLAAGSHLILGCPSAISSGHFRARNEHFELMVGPINNAVRLQFLTNRFIDLSPRGIVRRHDQGIFGLQCVALCNLHRTALVARQSG